MKFPNPMKKNWTQRYHITIWIRMFGAFITSLSSSMLAPFFLLYLHDKLNGAVLVPMLIVGLQPLTDIIVTLLGGGITDRLGRKPVMLLALTMQSIAMAGFIWADSVLSFALLYMLHGAGQSLFVPAQRAQIADVTTDSQRVEVFGLLNTISYTGLALGPVGGMLLFHYDPTWLFGIEALSIFIYMLVCWWKLPETAPVSSDTLSSSSDQCEASGTEKKEAISSDRTETNHVSVGTSRHRFFSLHRITTLITRYKYVLTLMIYTLPISFFYAQTETTFRIYLQESFVNYVSIIATLSTIKAILSVVLQLPLVKLTERFSFQRVMLLSCSCFMVTAVAYGFSKSMIVLILVQLTWTIGETIGLTRLHTYISEIAPPEERGRYFSLHGIHWDISRTFGPFLGGVVLLTFGGETLFSICLILLLLSGILFFRSPNFHKLTGQDVDFRKKTVIK
ncbi:MFS transporter [Brevibacillus laterosporus]|uniref:MDR family MFS transporter n=1 Tax=Brevibacillus laterosporus TaxID=1465 RepID=UPI0018CD6649|nr:MFS transporter [Brevibacillus laterosporus]MBG9797682.1 MFS transporter [Brevibacillus laterosporus]MCR8940108.1 MFS transporter [Brevibacillus laterosporus]MCZ0842748.1 MFS transporter [Brevibacillus laterosporus]MCZ0846631.1 MFS transporter [Brevibacillus laterosporus]MED1909625.1 MFS transporter [Brevibacillus laterosporus]